MTLEISQSTFRTKKALTIITASGLIALSVAILALPLLRANNPAAEGFLELDGNVLPNVACASPLSSSSSTDWACLFKQVSIFTDSTSPTPSQIAAAYVSNGLPLHAVASSFVPNGYSGGPLCPTGTGSLCPYPTAYTSGSKDTLDISANSCTSSNNLLAKDALINTYGIKYIDPTNGHQIAYIGDEKASNGGDNNIGVWFDANPVSVPSFPCSPTAPLIGSHAIGDILTVSNFTKGGALSGVNAYKWVGNGGSCADTHFLPLCKIFSGNVCDPSSPSTAFVCGAVSTGNICGFPWVTVVAGNKPAMNNTLTGPHCTVVNSFYEMGIDLTALGFTSCRTNAIPETRSSQEPGADLHDFTILNLNSCETKTTTQSSLTGVIAPNTPVTDTATVTSTSGGGAPAGTVQFYTCGPFPSSIPSFSTCNTSKSALDSSVTLSPATASSSTAMSPSFSPTQVGYYCFEAAYTPTATSGFLASSSTDLTNECFQVVAPTTTTTTSSATGTVSPGTGSVTDIATVATVPASAGTPTGTIQFYFCGPTTTPTSCAISPSNALGSPVTLVGGSATSTPPQSPTLVGFYCFSAVYTPDTTNFITSQSTTTVNECFQVVAPTTTTSSTISKTIVPGTSETDSVTVAAVPPSAGTPTGSVQFYVCGPTATATSCAISPSNALGSPITLTGGSATSGSISGSSTPINDNVPGFYCFSAVYTPDTSNFLPSSSTTTTNECFNVVNSIPKITAFGYTNSPTNNDPQTGSGTLVYTVTITNYGTTPATISGTLAITGSAVGTCTSSDGVVTSNSLALSASLSAFGNSGNSKTFTLTCSYAGNSGDIVTATLNAMFTNISGSGPVSGSPAGNFFTIQKA